MWGKESSTFWHSCTREGGGEEEEEGATPARRQLHAKDSLQAPMHTTNSHAEVGRGRGQEGIKIKKRDSRRKKNLVHISRKVVGMGEGRRREGGGGVQVKERERRGGGGNAVTKAKDTGSGAMPTAWGWGGGRGAHEPRRRFSALPFEPVKDSTTVQRPAEVTSSSAPSSSKDTGGRPRGWHPGSGDNGPREG